jgi:hypothetical protein
MAEESTGEFCANPQLADAMARKSKGSSGFIF